MNEPKNIFKIFIFCLFRYFSAYVGIGQEQTDNYYDFLNPYGKAKLYNKFNQFDYYGSGDANNDGIIDWIDSQAIALGMSNYRTDIDGDSVQSTPTDNIVLKDYLSGQIDRLPMDWENATTVAQRIFILESFINVDDTWYYNSTKAEWDCDQYARLAFFKSMSTSKADTSDWFISIHFIEQDMQVINEKWGQIPAYIACTSVKEGASTYDWHAVLCVFVGSDDSEQDTPLNFDSWIFINTTTGNRIEPGHVFMDENGEIMIKSYVYVFSPFLQLFAHTEKSLITYTLNEGFGELKNQHPGLIIKRPDRDTGIENAPMSKEIVGKLYPSLINSGQKINIQYNFGQPEHVDVYVIDSQGKLVYNKKENMFNKNMITIPSKVTYNLTNGIYHIRVQNSNGAETVKFIKL